MFKHDVFDNFLSNEHFRKLSTLNLKNINDNEISVYHNRYYKNGKIVETCLEKNFISELQEQYHLKAIDILKKYSSNKVDLYDYSEFHIVEIGKNFSFPIHRDTPNKLLSGVIYLSPEKNNGTFLFSDKKGNNAKEIKWKQNRALFFSRSENDSWHSYKADKQSNRLTLIYNLMTNDIKSVCKIEKLNYKKVVLREKINPYLLKFFKFMI